MNHKACAKIHVFNRFRGRYGRVPTVKDLDKIRISLKNKTCFLWQDRWKTICGIVGFGNIHIVAVYSKDLDCLLTVGCPLTKINR